MGVLYITSLHDSAGKTAFCAGLAHLLRGQGQRPALFKPVRVTGDTSDSTPDADASFFADLDSGPAPETWPIGVSFQEAQDGLQPSTIERALSALQDVSAEASDVIVEGVTPSVDQALAEALDAKMVLLARYTPDLRPDEIVSAAASVGQRLLGVVINGVPRYRSNQVQKSVVEPLSDQKVPVIGVLPEERCLMGITVNQMARHLGGKFLLWEEKGDQLVDHIMIGGLVLDWGVPYFSQNDSKAVVVRGDRPDIQMAALQTPTRCLVLTGGHHPIQYIEHEAREEEVPVIIVSSDTLTTVKLLETAFDETTVHHPRKAECFGSLVESAVDMTVLGSALNGH